MRTIAHLRKLSTIVAVALLSACASNPAPRTGVVYVRQGPPPRVVEVVAVAPSRAHVWIPGHYDWRGERYVWVNGRYALPPSGFRRYEPARWVHNRAGWYFVDGRWR